MKPYPLTGRKARAEWLRSEIRARHGDALLAMPSMLDPIPRVLPETWRRLNDLSRELIELTAELQGLEASE